MQFGALFRRGVGAGHAVQVCGVNARLQSKKFSVAAEELDRKFLIRNYNADGVRSLEGVEFARGNGCRLFDTQGREYVDWAAGIAVNGAFLEPRRPSSHCMHNRNSVFPKCSSWSQ